MHVVEDQIKEPTVIREFQAKEDYNTASLFNVQKYHQIDKDNLPLFNLQYSNKHKHHIKIPEKLEFLLDQLIGKEILSQLQQHTNDKIYYMLKNESYSYAL